MPHLRIDYSRGLEHRADLAALCRALHGAMVAAEIFPVAGIRIRAFAADHAIIGDGLAENDFAALTLSVGAGRSQKVLQAAGAKIFQAAQQALQAPLATEYFALSMEIRVIDPFLSWKDTPIHARLARQQKD